MYESSSKQTSPSKSLDDARMRVVTTCRIPVVQLARVATMSRPQVGIQSATVAVGSNRELLPLSLKKSSACSKENGLSLPSVQKVMLSRNVSVEKYSGEKARVEVCVHDTHGHSIPEADKLSRSEEGLFAVKTVPLLSVSPRTRHENPTCNTLTEPESAEGSFNCPSTVAVVEVHGRSVRRRLHFDGNNATSNMFARPAMLPFRNSLARDPSLGFREFEIVHRDSRTYRVAVASRGGGCKMAGNLAGGLQLRPTAQAAEMRGKGGKGRVQAATTCAAYSSHGDRTEMWSAGEGVGETAPSNVTGGGQGGNADAGVQDSKHTVRNEITYVGRNITAEAEVHTAAGQGDDADVAAAQGGQKRRRSQRVGRRRGGGSVLLPGMPAVPAMPVMPAVAAEAAQPMELSARPRAADNRSDLLFADNSHADESDGGEKPAGPAATEGEAMRRGVDGAVTGKTQEAGRGNECEDKPARVLTGGRMTGMREPPNGGSKVEREERKHASDVGWKGRECVSDVGREGGEGDDLLRAATQRVAGIRERRRITSARKSDVKRGRGECEEQSSAAVRAAGGREAPKEPSVVSIGERGGERECEELGDGRRWYRLDMEEGEVDLHLTLGTGQTFR